MSGTSFDGVDAALIKTDGNSFIELIDTSYIEYNKKEKKLYNTSIIKNYRAITKIIDDKHLLAIKKILNNNVEADIIGLHGQTLLHKPSERWTWQYINAELIAQRFKIKTISDFRLTDINNEGE